MCSTTDAVCVSACAGVSSLISLLTSAREADQPKLNVLLCEAVMAVYLALLIHGLGTHSSNELFQLAAHPLNNRMWAAIFGGGAKVIVRPKRPDAPPPGDVQWSIGSPSLSVPICSQHVCVHLRHIDSFIGQTDNVHMG